jgi:two-component system nitrogen regulation response regulator NtrX
VGDKSLSELRKEVEREYIVTKLEENEGNVTQTAKSLGIERTNLYKKMKYYDIDY